MNYPRRQQYRRAGRAVAAGGGAVLAGALALAVANLGMAMLAVVLLPTAIALGVYARHWARLARRSRVGARSEEQVQRTLAPLAAEGWHLRHSLPWQGRGDIDSIAIAPNGLGFAIETKTRSFEVQHLHRVHGMAMWLRTRRRRWCPAGALPVLCVVHASQLENVDGDVLIVSLDRLLPAIRSAAGLIERPAFLAR